MDKLSRATGGPSEALLRTFPWLARWFPVIPLHIGYKDVVRLRPDWYLAVHTDRRGVTAWSSEHSRVVFGGAGLPVALHTRLPD